MADVSIETNDRLFSPVIRENQTPSDIIVPDANEGVCYRSVYKNEGAVQSVRKTSIIVSIQGSCKSNGQSGSKASYGVHFGENSPYNTFALLPKGERQKSQNAQLFAAQKAIEIAEDVISQKMAVKQLIIKTHSAYLVRCLTEYVWIWEQNGYKNASKKPVINRIIIEKLQDMIKQGTEDGRLKIRFWLVGRAHNLEPIPLAKEAFKTHMAPEGIPVEQEEGWEIVGEEWQNPINYWTQIAPMEPAAQQLCQRLGIRLQKQKPGHFTGITAPIRRLVITGEDRTQNFERLFGPEWEAAVVGEWRSLRFEILTKPAPGTHLYDMARMLDEGAPWVRPRPASEEEMGRLKKMENIKVDLKLESLMELLAIG